MAALVGIPKQLIALPRPRITVRPHLAGDIKQVTGMTNCIIEFGSKAHG